MKGIFTICLIVIAATLCTGEVNSSKIEMFHRMMRRDNPDYRPAKASFEAPQGGGMAGRLTIEDCNIASLKHLNEIDVDTLILEGCTSPDWQKVGFGLLNIRTFSLVNSDNFKDFSLIKDFPRLHSCIIRGEIDDLSQLSGSRISFLKISSKCLKSICFLREMNFLQSLTLDDCTSIADYSPLSATRINNLCISGSSLFFDEQTAFIRNLPLTHLDLRASGIRSLDFLANCTELQSLCVPDAVMDYSCLAQLPNLSFLALGNRSFRGDQLKIWLINNTGAESRVDAGDESLLPEEPQKTELAETEEAEPSEKSEEIRSQLNFSFNDVQDKLVIVEQESGVGSGFLAKMDDAVYVLTNQHVIFGGSRIKFKTLDGKNLKISGFDASSKYDIIRFKVKNDDDNLAAFEFAEGVEMGEAIAVFGNSEGAGVCTELYGKIQGIGHDRVEISAEIVPGNSGSAILNKDMQVLAVATYVMVPAEDSDSIRKGTRFASPRRFGLRIDPGHQWQQIGWKRYQMLGSQIKEYIDYTDILYALTLDWFNDPYAEYDKRKYPDTDAACWISRHRRNLALYHKILNRGKVRDARELDKRNRQVRQALTDDYESLADLFRRKARHIRINAMRNKPYMNQFIEDQNEILALALERIAEQVEIHGKKLVQHDAFRFENSY